MTPELFTDLAIEFGELKREDIKLLTIREHYGFIDILEPQAKALLKNLNGIEYNGHILPVEVATSLSQRRSRERTENKPRSGNQKRQEDSSSA